jgi:antagonist of KipI
MRSGSWHVRWPLAIESTDVLELRFISGMQRGWFSEKAHRLFRESMYQISPASDRMGARLNGSALDCDAAATMTSQPLVAGSVQVPPDGRPILLMSDRQTIGGYPQIAHVISADLPKLARAWPGTKIRFSEVTLGEARTAWRDQQNNLAMLGTGLAFKSAPL